MESNKIKDKIKSLEELKLMQNARVKVIDKKINKLRALLNNTIL